MKVVLDANVLIAAFAGRGLCESIVELCIANDDVIVTSTILEDVHQKLVRKIKVPKVQASDIIEYLSHNVRVVEPSVTPARACRDPDDCDVLGAALAVGADYIITGDDDLLVLQNFQGIRIVKPRTYWEEFSRRTKL